MNWVNDETLKILAGRGRPRPRLARGLLWAVLFILLLSIVIFLLVHQIPLSGGPRLA